MKVLTLIIKQVYFDLIMSGEKTHEYREIRPKNNVKYLEFNDDGEVTVPRKYDRIHFYVGYQKNRDEAVVEIKDALIELFEDDEGNNVEYEYEGEKYLVARMNYTLGKIIEKTIHPKGHQ